VLAQTRELQLEPAEFLDPLPICLVALLLRALHKQTQQVLLVPHRDNDPKHRHDNRQRQPCRRHENVKRNDINNAIL
jgi:hypothetical protein